MHLITHVYRVRGIYGLEILKGTYIFHAMHMHAYVIRGGLISLHTIVQRARGIQTRSYIYNLSKFFKLYVGVCVFSSDIMHIHVLGMVQVSLQVQVVDLITFGVKTIFS